MSSMNLFGFTVTLERPDGTPFEMYGTRSLGRASCTTFVEAKEGGFQIRIKPQIPFPDPDRWHQTWGDRYQLRNRLPANMKCDQKSPELPYTFYSTVFIDGRQDSEDNTNNDLESASGEVFRGRTLKTDKQNQYRTFPWVFSQSGVECLLTALNLNAADEAVPATEHDAEMQIIMASMTAQPLESSRISRQGVITVVITREVELGPSDRSWKAEDATETDGSSEGQYQVIIDEDKEIVSRARSIKTKFYKEGEEFFTKFEIHYCDRFKLMKLGLMDSTGAKTDRKMLQAINEINASQHDALKRKVEDSDSESDSSESDSDDDLPRKKSRLEEFAKQSPTNRRGQPKGRQKMTLNPLAARMSVWEPKTVAFQSAARRQFFKLVESNSAVPSPRNTFSMSTDTT
jgi:hypothetical protein